MTLTGDVLAIGGLKEKLLAALRSNIHTVIIPEANKKDLSDLPMEVKKAIRIHTVKRIEAVFPLVICDYSLGQQAIAKK